MDNYESNRQAHHVAELLDCGNTNEASNRLREDLGRLQYDPREQHEFLNRVNQLERKGVGADLQIQRGPEGQEFWNIIPGQNQYQQERPYGYQPQPYEYQPQPYGYQAQPYAPQPYVVQPDVYRPDPGAAIVDGLAAGAGIALGAALIGRAFGGGGHNYYERRERFGHHR